MNSYMLLKKVQTKQSAEDNVKNIMSSKLLDICNLIWSLLPKQHIHWRVCHESYDGYDSRQSTSTLSHETYGIPVEPLLSSMLMPLESEDQVGTRMADYTVHKMEWTTYPDTSTHYSGFWKCLKSRLVYRLQPTHSSREMDTDGTPLTYQHVIFVEDKKH